MIFPQELIREPVIYQMARQFDVIFNIRRARVTSKVGEMVLELEGDASQLEKAMHWLKAKGIKVEPVTHDTIAG